MDSSDAQLGERLPDLRTALEQITDLARRIALDELEVSQSIKQDERHKIVLLVEILAIVVTLISAALILVGLQLNRQASVLRRKTLEAENSRLHLQTMIKASLDAVVVIDENATIRDFNGSAEDIFGIPHRQAVGQSFIDLVIPGEDREKQKQNLRRFHSTGETVIADKGRRETRLLRNGTDIFPAEISISLAKGAEGPVFIAYIRDITSEKEIQKEITEARDKAITMAKEKSRFFAIMSHEMRTPLNGVLSALQLLEDSPLDKKQKDFVNAAQISGDILLDHINDILEIERIETEQSPGVPTDIAAITSFIFATMDPLARGSGSTLRLNQQGLDDRLIMADPRSIQQILLNLIGNAIKFAPGTKITLHACFAARPYPDSGQELYLEVSDEGPGIPADQLDSIFDDFVSLDSGYGRKTNGAGLGLGIVNRLVTALSGEIKCHSQPGKGCRFVVRLPANPCVKQHPNPDDATGPARRCDPLKLLVVDDNEINRDLLKAMLENMGHSVHLADGGRSAIERCEIKRYDAILMDISMPEINGIDATRAIQKPGGGNRKTPIIAVTAHTSPEEQQSFKEAGLDWFLRKPLNRGDLEQCLHDISAPKPSPPPSDNSPAHPTVDTAQIAELLEILGKDKLRTRIELAIRQIEETLPAIIAGTDPATRAEQAHSLAGLSGMLGAKRLHTCLKSIEAEAKTGQQHLDPAQHTTLRTVWDATRSAWMRGGD